MSNSSRREKGPEQQLLFSRQSGGASDEREKSYVDPKATKVLEEFLHNKQHFEGFPDALAEEIIAISIPPFYTACPNPFIEDFLGTNVDSSYEQTLYKPLTQDITAGKNDPLYFSHFYSTKVPPDAIIPYIMHYTSPGDVVFDGFCGTGMTGVAAQLCADASRPSCRDGIIGSRRAILVDLSPAATFIAAGTNSIAELVSHLDDIHQIVSGVESDYKYLLTTSHIGWPRGTADLSLRANAKNNLAAREGHIEYVVWSDVFSCSECGTELIYWDLAFRGPGQPVPKEMFCTECRAEQSIRTLERIWITRFDHEIGQLVQQAKQIPVLINYSVGSQRFEKKPDAQDIEIISRLDEKPLPSMVPIVKMPDGFNTSQPLNSHGFSHVHHFFTRRNLVLITEIWNRVLSLRDPAKRLAGIYLLTGMVQRICRLNRYMPNHDRHVGPLSGTLYVSQLTAEIPATNYAFSRISDLKRCASGPTGQGIRISTQSATSLRNIPSDSIDYIFTDPPFGGNLNYSELNILVEAWLRLKTNTGPEAIVNEVQGKSLSDYQALMEGSFKEFYRILKPGQWMTVEFHNSQNAVWVSIQQALNSAGFVMADVRTLDKKKGTTKQLSYSSTVKQDLVISVYKTDGDLERRFDLEAGTEEGVWDFVRSHLNQLPVFVSKDSQAENIAERQNFLLFDRMVAFHVQRGVTVPLSAAELYAGLAQKFPERNGMYFLPEQIAEYDRKRMAVKELMQLELFVSDEETAIQWLRQQFTKKPQTFQDIHPQFLRELGGWKRHEKPLELMEILEENFIQYDGNGDVPGQIHSYLSTNFKDLRNLPKDDPTLMAKAKDRWYVPDPSKAGDLEKLRERSLLREFEEYRESKQKRLKIFRLEAVRTGFKKAWQERDYQTIIEIARKIPDNILQEDQKLLMWYDQALTRTEED